MSLKSAFDEVLRLQKSFYGHGDDAMSSLHTDREMAAHQLERSLADLLGTDVSVTVVVNGPRLTFTVYTKTK